MKNLKKIASFVLVLLVVLLNKPTFTVGATVFSDGFESTPDGYVNWSSGKPENGNWEIDASGHTGKASRVKGDNDSTKYLYKNVSTVGQQNIVLSYWFKSSDLSGGDTVTADWYDGSAWHTLFTIDSSTDESNWTQKTHNLPATANNLSSFKIRFKADMHSASRKVWLDDVSLSGTAMPTKGTLIVTKTLTNNDGGTAIKSNFSFIVNGGSATPFESDGSNSLEVDPGTYSVVEQGVPIAGYTTSYNSCSNIQIAAGQTKTCVITNNDVPDMCQNISGYQNAVPANSHQDGHNCVSDTATISATKVVCDAEQYLPNWGDGSPTTNITPSTATSFVATQPNHCHVQADWNFEWAPSTASNPGDQVGVAGGVWKAFGPTNGSGVATATIPYNDSVWVREQSSADYIPFSGDTSSAGGWSDVSAEMYCGTDVANYDNYDKITTPNGGSTYHCVAFNVHKPDVCLNIDGNQAEVPVGMHQDGNNCLPNTATVTMCKVDDQGTKLPGWTLMLKGVSVQSGLSVPVNSSAGVSSTNPLVAGVSYIAEAMGTWLNQGGANPVDAEYSTTDTTHGTNWTTHMDGYDGYSTNILELQIDNKFDADGSNWGTYNSLHKYAQGFVPTTTSSNFRIFDGTGTTQDESWFGDNSGNLSVNISKGYAGITGAEGCVSFPNVPYGAYTTDEVMQDGWQNVEGLQSVTVDSAQETFTIKNKQLPLPPPMATIHTTKIVCDAEQYLPNWGVGGSDIKSDTATNFLSVAENAQHCQSEPWTFEWAPNGTNNPGDNVATAGAPWTAFSTGTAQVPAGSLVWVREQPRAGYIPFTGQNTEQNVSAEMYCNTDVLNYDNYDFIDPVVGNQDYYCVGFNVPVAPVVPEVCPSGQHYNEAHQCVPDVNQCVDTSMNIVSNTNDMVEGHNAFGPLTFIHSAWTAIINGASWIWDGDGVANSTIETTKIFTKDFTVVGVPSDSSIEIASDNSYTIKINDTDICTDETGGGDSFASADNCTVPASALHTGTNTLSITVRNWAVEGSDAQSNPAGLMYKLHINAEDCPPPAPTTGSIEITKYLCPAEFVPNRTNNGVGSQVPQGCVAQNGVAFGYVHGTQEDALPEYPELNMPLTPGGVTTGGVLTIANLPATGRYLVKETDGTNLAGLYCQGDGDTDPNNNDNQELTFVHAGDVTKCVAYNKAPVVVVDVCSNIADNQATPPQGTHLEGNQCVPNDNGGEGVNTSETFTVDSSALNGWSIWNFDNDNNNDQTDVVTTSGTDGNFVTGPASAPLGTGSFEQVIGTDGNDADRLVTSQFNGIPLANITELGYSTFVNSYVDGQATYLQLRIDVDHDGVWNPDAPGSVDDALFFEPVYQTGDYPMQAGEGSIPNQCVGITNCAGLNTWQTWNAKAGGWWANSGAGGPPLLTLAKYIADHPGAVLATDTPAIRLQTGFGSGAWDNFKGNFDKFVIGVQTGSNIDTKTFDFEPEPATVVPQSFARSGGGGLMILPPAPKPQVLGASTQCGLYLDDFLKMGKKNNKDEVKKLQTFLNDYLKLDPKLPVNGTFGLQTYKAVVKFQEQEADYVLKPWVGVTLKTPSKGTGWVYKTTVTRINNIMCPELNLSIPPAIID